MKSDFKRRALEGKEGRGGRYDFLIQLFPRLSTNINDGLNTRVKGDGGEKTFLDGRSESSSRILSPAEDVVGLKAY